MVLASHIHKPSNPLTVPLCQIAFHKHQVFKLFTILGDSLPSAEKFNPLLLVCNISFELRFDLADCAKLHYATALLERLSSLVVHG